MIKAQVQRLCSFFVLCCKFHYNSDHVAHGLDIIFYTFQVNAILVFKFSICSYKISLKGIQPDD
jgi:hypothetical protein